MNMVLAETLRCKLGQTAPLLTAYRGTYQRPIQRYHRRPSTTYRLATIQMLQTDDRQTDRTS